MIRFSIKSTNKGSLYLVTKGHVIPKKKESTNKRAVYSNSNKFSTWKDRFIFEVFTILVERSLTFCVSLCKATFPVQGWGFFRYRTTDKQETCHFGSLNVWFLNKKSPAVIIA